MVYKWISWMASRRINPINILALDHFNKLTFNPKANCLIDEWQGQIQRFKEIVVNLRFNTKGGGEISVVKQR